jgi:4-oxalocrotonate tautomerase family enzyme
MKEADVPIVEVKLYDARVTEESVPKIIEAMTNALAESSGAAKEHIQVLVEGVSPKNWGIAGEPQG